ncbi:MAG: hypothetical protein LZF62_480231 [Nitrospira sp.]|nr:MAG: hypothetical protein LZF62_480231 [Nitrospira sp.]
MGNLSINVRRVTRLRLCWVLLILLCLMSSGCVFFSEKYFIEVQECRENWPKPHSSFIKLDLYGKAFFTTSKFEMGWYDKRAVDTLFATMDRNADPATQYAAGRANSLPGMNEEGLNCAKGSKEQVWRRTRIYGPNGQAIGDAEGKRLVLFVTSNPNDLVNRISTTANTLATSEQMAKVLRRNELGEATDADLDLSLTGRRHEVLALDAQEFLGWLEAAQSGGSLTVGELKARLNALSAQVESTLENK